jgi:tRNA dimethylallyltransferase
MTQKPLVLIAGPTASGKSALAISLARLGSGEIINADASQVYRDLRILSARPTAEEEQTVPHHLFGFMDGAQACSTGLWRDHAVRTLEAVHQRHKLPIIVGGTGLYLRTLLHGIADVPEIPPAVRTEVRNLTPAALRTALEAEDPESAARLNPADRQRQARALEVIRGTGKPLLFWQQQMQGGLLHRPDIGPILQLVLLPDRAALYDRCDARFAAMMAAGAMDEVAALQARHMAPDLPVMKAVGVPELLAHLSGAMSRADSITAATLATRHYAKRQYTWMRNQFGTWRQLEGFGDSLVNDELAILLREYGLTVK